MLVFEDNDYLGVVLKKDIEMSLVKGDFELFQNINCVKPAQVAGMLFRGQPDQNVRIPVIDKAGGLIRIISYEEYLSCFHYSEMIERLDLFMVFDYLEHAVIVTNHFKKILYANKAALRMAGKDLPGLPFSVFLRLFEIRASGPLLEASRDGVGFHVLLSRSESAQFSYIVYQFTRK